MTTKSDQLISSGQAKNKKQRSLFIPFINSTIYWDLKMYNVLQPLFWLFGLELIVPVFYLLFVSLKRVLINAQIRVPKQSILLFSLVIWQLLHFLSVPPGEYDLYLKSLGTMIALWLLYILVFDQALSMVASYEIRQGLIILSAVSTILGTLYILGILSVQFNSLIANVLPRNLVENSYFFKSISTRYFGYVEFATGLKRVRSTFWHPSSYATILIVFFAINWYESINSHGRKRFFLYLNLLNIILNLIFTFSRVSIIAFGVMSLLIWWLVPSNYLKSIHKIILVLTMVLVALVIIISILFSMGSISTNFLNDIFYQFRPDSILVRLKIYQETFPLILQKPIWGWTTQIKLDNLPSYFSAGSHSDLLSITFTQGIIGALLYFSFILSLWIILIKGYIRSKNIQIKNFFAITIALMAAINIRQISSELLWDIYVASSIFIMWGLATAFYRITILADDKTSKKVTTNG